MTYFTTLPLFLGNFRGWEWVIIGGLFFLFFGSAVTIRKVMRNAGKSVNAFKQGLEDAKAEMRKPIEEVKEAATQEPKNEAPAKDIDR